MPDYHLIFGYTNNELHRNHFTELLGTVFHFSLEDWYQRGYWDDRYRPYSLLDGNRMVANVSVNKMDLVIQGTKVNAIQIGTVMTHPDYRGKGLSVKLMEYVLEKYESEVDLVYLFAHAGVREFYPRFGFKECSETQFIYTIPKTASKPTKVEKLDLSDQNTCEYVYQKAKLRKPVSHVFGVEDGHNLFMYHCLYLLSDCLYSINDGELLMLCKQEGNSVHLYDIVSEGEIDFSSVLAGIAGWNAQEIVFHFTPDRLEIKVDMQSMLSNDLLFVKPSYITLPDRFRTPRTAEA